MIGIISEVALSYEEGRALSYAHTFGGRSASTFIVHEPSGIMQCTRERSLLANLNMYLRRRRCVCSARLHVSITAVSLTSTFDARSDRC